MQVAERRKTRGLTQKELAQKVGVSRALISLVEIGAVRPYPSLKKRIARALGVGVRDLFEGKKNDQHR